MVIVKGDKVMFDLEDGRRLVLPKKHGMVHDPEGEQLHKCDVFFCSYRVLSRNPPGFSRRAQAYFGSGYKPVAVKVDVPRNGWEPVGRVTMIYYRRGTRDGAAHRGGYHHPFKSRPVPLLKSGRCYKLDLPDGCVVDDRGFVVP